MNQLNVETIKLTDRRTSFNVSSIIALITLGVVAQIHQYMQVHGTDYGPNILSVGIHIMIFLKSCLSP